MRHLRTPSSYLKRITLSDPTHVIRLADLVAISVKTLRIESECFLEKDFTELIHMNLSMVLYLNFNQFDLCHSCVCAPLT